MHSQYLMLFKLKYNLSDEKAAYFYDLLMLIYELNLDFKPGSIKESDILSACYIGNKHIHIYKEGNFKYSVYKKSIRIGSTYTLDELRILLNETITHVL